VLGWKLDVPPREVERAGENRADQEIQEKITPNSTCSKAELKLLQALSFESPGRSAQEILNSLCHRSAKAETRKTSELEKEEHLVQMGAEKQVLPSRKKRLRRTWTRASSLRHRMAKMREDLEGQQSADLLQPW
jgi:hypothetical protein